MPRHQSDILNRLCIVHDTLSDACDFAEDHFSFQILTITSVTLIDILLTVFRILKVAFRPQENEMVLHRMVYAVFCTVVLFVIISVSVRVMDEVRHRVELNQAHNLRTECFQSKCLAVQVHKAMNVLDNKDFVSRRTLRQFSNQLLNRPLQFTAWGLFPLDYTLVLTVSPMRRIAGHESHKLLFR